MTEPVTMDAVENPVIATPFGRFRCFEDQFADDLRRYGAHQRSDLAVMLAAVRPGDVVVDVGAFIGTVAVPLGRAVGPNGHIFCFEPVKDHHALLVENLSVNGVASQATPVHALVSRSTGVGEFTTLAWSMSTATTSFAPAEDSAAQRDEVMTWRLDDWFAAHAADRGPVRLLKIDVEGMELAVLQGAEKLIDTDRPILELEVGGGREGRTRDTETFLRDHGYRVLLNVAPRDAGSDHFRLGSLSRLSLVGDMLTDVVAVPREREVPLPVEAGWLETQWTVIAGRLRLRSRLRRLRGRLNRP